MNKKNVMITTWVATGAAVTGVVASGGLYLLYTSHRQSPIASVEEERSTRHEVSARVLGNSSKEDPKSVYRALISISNEIDPEVLPQVKSLSESKVDQVRAAAGYALSFQTDADSISRVEKLADDRNILVRSHLIHAARQGPGEARIKILQKILKNPILSHPEKAEAMAALFHSQASHPDDAEITLSALFREAQKKNNGIQESYLVELNRLGIEDERLINLNHKALLTSSNPLVLSTAIQHLALRHDSKLKKNLSTWIHHSEPLVKRAAIQSLGVLCPRDRWELMSQGFHAEPSMPERAAWIMEAEQLQGKNAQAFLEMALGDATKKGNTTETKWIQTSLSRVQSSGRPEVCDKISGQNENKDEGKEVEDGDS